MRIAAYVLVSALAFPSAAQIQMMSDRCVPALTESGRNELLAISQRDREAYHYRRVCQSSGVDAGTELEKARVTLGFSYRSRHEYCLSEASKFKDYSFDYLRTSMVIEKALQVWLECHRLNRAGIIATPIVEPERFMLTLQRGSTTTKGIVNWAKTNAGTKCFGKLGNGKLTEIETDVNLVLPAAETWTLVCDRVAVNRATEGGVQFYPATTITVDTTAGPFQMKLPAEPLATEPWASQISKRLDDVETSLTAMNSRIDSVHDSIPNAVAVTVGGQQGIVDNTTFAGQKAGTAGVTNFAECAENRVLSAFKVWQGASAMGYYYKCATLSLVRR